MRLVFLGSGAFGLPTLRSLDSRHDLLAVVSQPDRPAGRARRNTPTPVSEWAMAESKSLIRPENVNDVDVVEEIRGLQPDALVVIAFGQKIGEPLLEKIPAFNLHASLLPAYRGAAPINRAMIDGCTETGVSVIELAQRMDAGDVHATRTLAIDPLETAGELHDRLAELGPEAVESVLEALASGESRGVVQDEASVSQAPKLSRAESSVDFEESASRIRDRIHGLTPWPGCDIDLDGQRLRVLRVAVTEGGDEPVTPGTLLPEHRIACGEGALELLEVQPIGKRPMTFKAYLNGRRLEPGVLARRHG